MAISYSARFIRSRRLQSHPEIKQLGGCSA